MPLSQNMVTMVFPFPYNLVALTTAQALTALELPRKSPSFYIKKWAISIASSSVTKKALSITASLKLSVYLFNPIPSVTVSNGCLRRCPSASSPV